MNKKRFLPLLTITLCLFLTGCSTTSKKVENAEPATRKVEPKKNTLAERLSKQMEKSKAKITPEFKEIMQGATEALARSSIVANFFKPGDGAPDFTLKDVNDQEFNLKKELEKGPVVISFYRGSWCPYCNLELIALQEKLPEIKRAGAQLVAISPELPEHGKDLIKKHGIEFVVLSDVGNKTARDYNLVFKLPDNLIGVYEKFGINLGESNGDDSHELPVPATFVIGTDSKIKYAYADVDYRKRAEPANVVKALNELVVLKKAGL